MNKEIKQKIVSDWFKILQDLICKEIESIEGKKSIFKSEWLNSEKKIIVQNIFEYFFPVFFNFWLFFDRF